MSVAVIVATLCAAAYLGLTVRPPSLTRSAVKTASVALLAVAAGVAGAPLALVVALALCALGDWFLSRGSEAAFGAGVGAFAAGHIAYVLLFLTRPGSDPGLILTTPRLWVAVAMLLSGAIMAALLTPRAGALKWPVLAYVPVILGMGISALAVPSPMALAIPAAIAFMLSDMILSADKFLLPAGHPARTLAPYLVWVLYWGAQAGFLAVFA